MADQWKVALIGFIGLANQLAAAPIDTVQPTA